MNQPRKNPNKGLNKKEGRYPALEGFVRDEILDKLLKFYEQGKMTRIYNA